MPNTEIDVGVGVMGGVTVAVGETVTAADNDAVFVAVVVGVGVLVKAAVAVGVTVRVFDCEPVADGDAVTVGVEVRVPDADGVVEGDGDTEGVSVRETDADGVVVREANVDEADGVTDGEGVVVGVKLAVRDDVGDCVADNDVDTVFVAVEDDVAVRVDEGVCVAVWLANLFVYVNVISRFRWYEPPVPPPAPKKAWQPTETPGHRYVRMFVFHDVNSVLPPDFCSVMEMEKLLAA